MRTIKVRVNTTAEIFGRVLEALPGSTIDLGDGQELQLQRAGRRAVREWAIDGFVVTDMGETARADLVPEVLTFSVLELSPERIEVTARQVGAWSGLAGVFVALVREIGARWPETAPVVDAWLQAEGFAPPGGRRASPPPRKPRFAENQRAIERIWAGDDQDVVFDDWRTDRKAAKRRGSANLKALFQRSVLRPARLSGELSKVPLTIP